MERAKDFFIILDDVSLVSFCCCTIHVLPSPTEQTDLSFGREYTAAVEAKQVGE